MKRIKGFVTILLVMSCWFTGCGETSQPDYDVTSEIEVVSTETPQGFGEASNEEGEIIYYGLTESAVSDEQAVLLELVAGKHYDMDDPFLFGGKIYRYVITFKEAGVYGDCYLQVYDINDKKWSFVDANVEVDVEEKTYSGFDNVYASANNLYATFYSQKDGEYYLSSLNDDSLDKIYGIKEYDITIEDGKGSSFFGYQVLRNELIFYSNALIEQKRVTVPGKILGLVQNAEGTTYWYGPDEEQFLTIRDVYSGDAILEQFAGVISTDCKVERSSKGELFIADRQGIWKLEEEPILIYDFMKNDYIVDIFYDMNADENGGMELLVKLDGVLTILHLAETDSLPVTDKEEVVIAFAMDHLAMKKVIARFNRQSEAYHVSMLLPEENEDLQNYQNRIQMEMSVGKGPDILGHDMIYDVESYVENGYLECLNGLLDEQNYLQAALEGCRLNNDLYGIPYDCQFTFAAYRKSDIGEQDAVTIEELMRAVEVSGAAVLEGGATGLDIVRYYGLYDSSNKSYIDWEKGESHLTEKEFIQLMEFAKKYSDSETNDQYEGRKAQDREAFAVSIDFDELHWLNYMEACLEGEGAILGYPCEEGNGIYITCRELYINQGASCKEGAKEFLKYLLSAEEQMRYIKYDITEELTYIGTLFGYRSQFPIHKDAFETMVMLGKNNTKEEYYQNYGVSYENHSLEESQVEQFMFLVNHAKPIKDDVTLIFSFITEELSPYFEGAVSAEVAAEKLDNRVQLYLDERK